MLKKLAQQVKHNKDRVESGGNVALNMEIMEQQAALSSEKHFFKHP